MYFREEKLLDYVTGNYRQAKGQMQVLLMQRRAFTTWTSKAPLSLL